MAAPQSFEPPGPRDRGVVRPTHSYRDGPETPVLDALDAVLAAYRPPPPVLDSDEAVRRDAERRFVEDFRRYREVTLRTMLEEVAWRLEQRGHHAWLDEESADGHPPAPRDAITLSLVPIGYAKGRDEPSTLTFVAVPETLDVLVLEHIGGTAHRDVPIGDYGLDQLDEANVAALAAELVRRAFTAYPPVPSVEGDDPSIARGANPTPRRASAEVLGLTSEP